MKTRILAVAATAVLCAACGGEAENTEVGPDTAAAVTTPVDTAAVMTPAPIDTTGMGATAPADSPATGAADSAGGDHVPEGKTGTP